MICGYYFDLYVSFLCAFFLLARWAEETKDGAPNRLQRRGPSRVNGRDFPAVGQAMSR